MINMENVIREMQQNLVDDYFVAFIFKNDYPRFQLGKSDEFHLLNDNWLVIRKENGITQVINLDYVSEIRIRRKAYK